MHGRLLHSSGLNLGDILGTVGSMTASVELALTALVLWLSAVLDTMAFGPTIETLVVSWRRTSLAFPLLLLIPREGADVFFSSWP